MTNEAALAEHLAELILQQGARLKLDQPGRELGIAGTIAEVYDVDRAVKFSEAELQPLVGQLLNYSGHGDVWVGSGAELVLTSFIVFCIKPEAFTESDAARPIAGSFADFSRPR